MTSARRIKHSEIKSYREKLLAEQMNICALCLQHLDAKDAVLDHCHKTGHLRSALHRFCNTFLGKIENNISRNKITPIQLENILRNVQAYISTVKEEIHPTHKTPEERQQRAKKRAQARRKKR